MKKHTYIIGTGVSHDGSACLLKDGEVCVAIEKERITRIKHDGGNDSVAIEYCLSAAGITIRDVDLIVQNANFGNFRFGSDFCRGFRPFSEEMGIPIVTISHHLAHAYSTIGTCPFDEFAIMVMDGCGNSFDDCIDVGGCRIPELDAIKKFPHLFHEKDSYYRFDKDGYAAIMKDFSEWGHIYKDYPLYPETTKHTIGGLYAAVSVYCFGTMEDPGKLMGLSPYGKPGEFKEEVFETRDGRIFLNYDWMDKYRRPARSYADFRNNFQYYADIACGVQQEVERAILYIIRSRLSLAGTRNLCYSGGTALNALANARICDMSEIANVYIEPAAGDNGLSLGCAFYGWMEVLKRGRVKHNGSTCFGRVYPAPGIKTDIESCGVADDPMKMKKTMDLFFSLLGEKKRHFRGTPCNIQLNVEGFGVFQIMLNETLKAGNDIFGRPTSNIFVKGNDFYDGLLTPNGFQAMVKQGRMNVTNPKEVQILQELVDIEEVCSLLRKRVNGNENGRSSGITYLETEDFIAEAAGLLAQGYIIGWFQDGSEFGPRALGRRSILCDPRKKGAREFINTHIKFREDFRPFAPSVLQEDAAIYFKTGRESPYMILVDEVRNEYREQIGEVVHVNNTSRVQTVTADWSPKYYALIREFKKLTGLSLLLNTSFNRKGMPIVETPSDALNFFRSCKLEYLVMDRFIISKD